MKILLTKASAGRPGALTCIRADGSQTWQPSTEYFARHDLVHFAIETAMEYAEAFLGRVATGKDLDAYGTRGGVKDHYTVQESWAEQLAGLLQISHIGGQQHLTIEEIAEMLAIDAEVHHRPAPSLNAEQLDRIRASIDSLHAEWRRVPPGGIMELEFPERSPAAGGR